MRARQQVSFSVPHIPEVQRISVGANITNGSFLLSLGSMGTDGQPQTYYSSPSSWNESAANMQLALSALPANLTVTQVWHLC